MIVKQITPYGINIYRPSKGEAYIIRNGKRIYLKRLCKKHELCCCNGAFAWIPYCDDCGVKCSKVKCKIKKNWLNIKKMPKLYKGPRGGKYYWKNKKKIYIN